MKKSITSTVLSAALCLFCMAALSCSNSGDATVRIIIDLPKNVSVLRHPPDTIVDRALRLVSSPVFADTPVDVASIVLRVSGPGMTTHERSYFADTVLISLAVESGKDRVFFVKAYNADGRVICTGSVTESLAPAETKDIAITMKPTLRMVADINPLSASSSDPSGMIRFGDRLYFSASDDSHGSELWVYDPQTGDSWMLYDINQGGESSYPSGMTVFDDKMYFSASDTDYTSTGGHGTELWVYDGENNPSMVCDINVNDDGYGGTSSSNPSSLTVYNNRLYFAADDGVNGDELWMYDGLALPAVLGTNIVMYDINELEGVGSIPEDLTVYNDGLYFHASGTVTQQEYGSELWSVQGDGVPSMVLDIYFGVLGSNPSGFAELNGNLYFTAEDYTEFGSTDGSELWMYDGSSASMIADINQIMSMTDSTYGSDPQYLTVMDNYLFFNASDGVQGEELWMYDTMNPEVSIGTNPLQVIINDGESSSWPGPFLALNGQVYFAATPGGAYYYMYSYQPGNADAVQLFQLVSQIQKWDDCMVNFENLIAYQDTFGETSSDIWIYDPARPVPETPGINPFKLKINPVIGYDSSAQILMVDGNCLYLSANDGINGQELWVYEYYE